MLQSRLKDFWRPGAQWLFLACLLGFLLSFTSVGQDLEHNFYDFQLRLTRWLLDDPEINQELILVALDKQAEEQGLSRSDLKRAADYIRGTTSVIPDHGLKPFFETDDDGILRGIRLYRKTEQQVLGWSPLFRDFLEFKGLTVEQATIRSWGVEVGPLKIPTDRSGRVYPLFPYPEREGKHIASQNLATKILRAVADTLFRENRSGVARLNPVSLLHLGEIHDKLDNRLTVLGTHVQAADNLDLPTPMGHMVALELYGSIHDSLLSSRLLVPLNPWSDLCLGLVFLLWFSWLLPGKSAGNAAGWWLTSLVLWLAVHQGLFVSGHFGHQVPALVGTGQALLVHLFLRSRLLARLLYGFGGHEAVETEQIEIEATICFTNLPKLIMELESKDLNRSNAARAAYAECLGHVVERHGGRIVDQQGDAQMLAFGLADEPNHAWRAVACSLDIVAAVGSLLDEHLGETVGGVHCGVVTGQVARGQVGGGSYKSVAAIGDTTNTAARLMGRAMKDGRGVLASGRTMELVGPRASSEACGEIRVKGKEEAVLVKEVLGLSEVPTPILTEPNLKPPRAPLSLALVALLLTLVTSGVLEGNLPLRLSLLDNLTTGQASAPVYWAALDEESLALQAWPWPRSWHAEVIKNLESAGAKCVFYDIIFDRPSTTEEDTIFIQAVKESSIVVLGAAASASLEQRPRKPKLMGELIESGHWAVINAIDSGDKGLIRSAWWNMSVSAGYERPAWEGPGVAKAVVERVAPERLPEFADTSTFLVRWGPQPQRFSYRRLLDPTDPIFSKLRGGVVVVADGLKGASDEFVTPRGRMKGGLVHCLSIQTALTGELLRDESGSAGTWLLALTAALLTFWGSLKYSSFGHQGLLLALGSMGGLALTILVAELGSVYIGTQHVQAVPCALAFAGALRMFDVARALNTYVPKAVQERLEAHGFAEERSTIATVLLTDIRGYTTLSEGRSPLEILNILNRYHELTAACYEAHGGHLLTYQGDAQIVVFGPFKPLANPVAQALKAARKLDGLVKQVADEAGLEGEDVIRVGAGITTGRVSLSIIKAGEQLQYTVLGEPVRHAHKLQALSDKVGSNIILDQNSYLAIMGTVACRSHADEQGRTYFTPDG